MALSLQVTAKTLQYNGGLQTFLKYILLPQGWMAAKMGKSRFHLKSRCKIVIIRVKLHWGSWGNLDLRSQSYDDHCWEDCTAKLSLFNFPLLKSILMAFHQMIINSWLQSQDSDIRCLDIFCKMINLQWFSTKLSGWVGFAWKSL